MHVQVRRGQVVRRQAQPDRHRLPSHGRAVHNFIFAQRRRLGPRIRPGPRRLAPPDLELHVLEADADQQERNAAEDDVGEVVAGLVVLELDVEAVLDADLHLDRGRSCCC